MKPAKYKFLVCSSSSVCRVLLWAQEAEMVAEERKPVKNMFESIWIIDNQTVMVPFKNTLEFDIQHRFDLSKTDMKISGVYMPHPISVLALATFRSII